MQDYKKQIVVIGGGAGGLSMASVLSRLGYKVTLVEKQEKLGGDCLHYGCVPSKAFIKIAKMAHYARNSKKYGIATEVKIDFNKVQAYVKEVIANIQKHDDPVRFKSYGVDVIFGTGHFVGEHMLSIDNKLVPAEKFIIATGSKPAIPKIEGLDKVNYYTNENILDITKQPNKLIIIGGGPIGLEYAQAFARLGTKVIIIEMLSKFMAQLDQIQMGILKDHLSRQGVDFISNAKIEYISQKTEDNISVKLSIKSEDDNNITSEVVDISGDSLLIAAGREPQIDNLGLDLIGVNYNNKGIIVDDNLRTSLKHIYAVGDVVDTEYKYTHVAEYHASVVIKNLAYKLKSKVNYKAVPRVIYTDPEWAQVGLTEKEANKKNISHQVIVYQLSNLDRGIISGETSGNIKLIVKRNKLLGASILSPIAGELIHELALAIQNDLRLTEITNTIHAYPTWSQMHRRVINQYYEPKLFGGLSRFLVRFLQLFG